MRNDLQEIKPGYGLGIIKFGMTRDEVKAVLGEPNEIDSFSYTDDDQELTETWEYESLGLSLNFDEEDDWRLVLISVTDDYYRLQGKEVIGQTKDNVLAILKELDLGFINLNETENDDPDNQRISLELLGLDFWFDYDILDEIQLSPQFIDDDTIKWPDT